MSAKPMYVRRGTLNLDFSTKGIPELILGIDLDHHQGDIDWLKLKNTSLDYDWPDSCGPYDWDKIIDFGIRCIVVGVTEGYGDFDPNYKRNYLTAHANGFLMGTYHFAYPSKQNTDAWKEANYYFDRTASLPCSHLPPCLDLEQNKEHLSKEEYTAWAETFMALTVSCSDSAMIYGSDELDDWLLKDNRLGSYPVFVPRHGRNDGFPRIEQYNPKDNLAKEWDDWNIWQFTSNGRVPGIDNRCDMFLAKRDWLLSLPGMSIKLLRG